mgnify:CR=1 FL=1
MAVTESPAGKTVWIGNQDKEDGMDLNYQEIADRAAAHALKSGIILDYSEKALRKWNLS